MSLFFKFVIKRKVKETVKDKYFIIIGWSIFHFHRCLSFYLDFHCKLLVTCSQCHAGAVFATTLIELANEPTAMDWSWRVGQFMVCSIANVRIPLCISPGANVSHIRLFVCFSAVCLSLRRKKKTPSQQKKWQRHFNTRVLLHFQ